VLARGYRLELALPVYLPADGFFDAVDVLTAENRVARSHDNPTV
jgi:hypothetical protein